MLLAEGLAPSGNNNPDLSSLQVAAERAMIAVEAIPKPAKRPVNAKPKPKASRRRP